MRRLESRTDPRLKRFAWMAALVVVLRFVAWDLHHAGDAHEPHHHEEETCQLCLVLERGGDSDTATAGPGLPPPPAAMAVRETPPACHDAPAPCPPPRGPPALLS